MCVCSYVSAMVLVKTMYCEYVCVFSYVSAMVLVKTMYCEYVCVQLCKCYGACKDYEGL